ncbi:MAG TPA: BTAD domain-containing putative transcriptional regulator, partial [Pilimelia sp.]|nr:BTAD domain-containing putative transcriptional regulator [Pilimelia sp.]
MDFQALGPLQVTRDGEMLHLGTAYKPRLVLAALLSRAEQTATTDWLVGVVWGDHTPASARRNLHLYIHRLRTVLGADRLPSRPDGYAILPGDAFDVARFRRLATAGSAALVDGDPERAGHALRTALDLWHGPAYGEFTDCREIAEPAARLEEQRLTAYEQWAAAQLALGHDAGLVETLTDLVRTQPFRESLRAHLMRALYRSGRQAEALQVFRDARMLLRDQLGIEPGPQLQRLHEQMLRGDSQLISPAPLNASMSAVTVGRGTASPVPRELPADVYGFAGRGDELAWLDAVIAATDERPTAVVISAISGTAGVGKTALAVHWAHRVRDRFPDGQLYVNLRGFDPSGTVMAPAEAVRRFLDALNVPPQRIPADPDAQVNLYRTLLADKTMLVVLDNARDPEQVQPLLPGARGCLVLVTSRNRLTGLVAAAGARALPLDLLTVDAARDLLIRRLGPARVTAEPDAVDEIITACARLPLALAVVAATAATHPRLSLAALAGQIRDSGDRLAVLSTGDTPATDARSVFSWSYQALSDDSARLFRLLGLHPGPDISAAAAASLAAAPIDQVRPLLTELANAHLTTEHTPGRYTFHDLLRAYAADLAHATDTDQQRHAATHRILDHYLHTASAGSLLLDPHRDPVEPAPPAASVAMEALADPGEALAWFTTERLVLLAAVSHAAAAGFDDYAGHLASALTTFLRRQGYWADWAETQRVALAAARRLADRLGQAQAHRSLARAYIWLGRYGEARTEYGHALGLYCVLGDRIGQAHTYLNLGWLAQRQGSYEEALKQGQTALELYLASAHRRGQANALNDVGWCYAQLGDHERAIGSCHQAILLFQETGELVGQATTWDSIGYANHHLGRHEQAVVAYRQALDLYRQQGNRYGEAETLIHLGDTYQVL